MYINKNIKINLTVFAKDQTEMKDPGLSLVVSKSINLMRSWWYNSYVNCSFCSHSLCAHIHIYVFNGEITGEYRNRLARSPGKSNIYTYM